MRATDYKSPCWVCGSSQGRYAHDGKHYCVRRSCQLVAMGDWTRDQARRDLSRRGYVVR